eukprot:Skav221210  [mRNA]  locus=scaffold2467:135018:136547:- [translate_table: standard]
MTRPAVRCFAQAFKIPDQQATEWMYVGKPAAHGQFNSWDDSDSYLGFGQEPADRIVWTDHLKKLQAVRKHQIVSECGVWEELQGAPAAHSNSLRGSKSELFVFAFKPQDIFLEFEFDPVASASIAQVHKAIMRESGEEALHKRCLQVDPQLPWLHQVAVKLQHEGVEPCLAQPSAVKRGAAGASLS